jgi:gliding motility-associated-like protein
MKHRPFFWILIILLFSPYILWGQQGNVWCFGYKAGLDFNYDPPKPINTAIKAYEDGYPGDKMSYFSTSVSNCKGQLLFYGNDEFLFNRLHKVMPHGQRKLDPGTYGSGNHILILPFQNDTSRFYIFYSIGEYTNPPQRETIKDSGTYYSVVDMSLDSGRGDVDTNYIHVKMTDFIPNTTVLVPHSNGKDKWFVDFVKGDSIIAWPITSSGIGYPRGEKIKLYSDWGYFGRSVAKCTHKGDKIVMGDGLTTSGAYYTAYIYDFNNTTGKISFAPKLLYTSTDSHASGAEFSPNDSFLYVGISGRHFDILQYKTYDQDIANTATRIYYLKVLSGDGFSFQLAPNNKIYWNHGLRKVIGVIDYPEKRGLAAKAYDSVIYLKDSMLASPFMPELYFPVHHLDCAVQSGCRDSFKFSNKSDSNYFKSFTWYFGDGDSSTAYAPYHKYAASGKYFVKLRGINGCGAKQWFTDSIEVHKPPHALFKRDTFYYTCGQANLKVTSTAKEKDIIQTYWQWGDGTAKDSGLTAVHAYDSSGKFALKQTVITPSCSDTKTDTVAVAIEASPKAAIKPGITGGCTPFTAALASSSANADSVNWLVDGQYAYQSASLTHTFTDTGWHNVRLTAFNRQGCRDTLLKAKYIYVSPRPVASYTFAADTFCQGMNLSFTAQPSLKSTYRWDFGDGTKDTGRTPIHTFASSKTYPVSLTVSNAYCDSVFIRNITIALPDKPVAAFEFPNDKVCIGPVQISNQSTGKDLVYRFYWNGKPYVGRDPVFVFPDTGSEQIKLVVTDRYGCSDSVQKSIRVLPWPKASFEIKDSSIGCQSRTYTLKNTSKGSIYYTWFFFDGSADNHQDLKHTFTKDSNYVIRLIATNGYCNDTFSRTVRVRLRPAPEVGFQLLSDTTGCAPFKFSWIDKTANIDSLEGNFGDFTSKTLHGDTQQHVYNNPGIYVFWLRGFTNEGCSVASRQVMVRVLDSLSARIHADKVQGCSPLEVQLSNKGYVPGGVQAQYLWEATDGQSTMEQSPQMRFVADRDTFYTIKLYVKAGSCIATDSLVVHVHSLNAKDDSTRIAGATVLNNKDILVQWHPVKGATAYDIQRKADTSNYQPYKTVTDTFFIDGNVDVTKPYRYRITGVDDCDNKAMMSGIAGNIVLTADKAEMDTSALLKWMAYEKFNKGVRDYYVERKAQDGSWQSLDSLAGLQYLDRQFSQDGSGEQCYRVTAGESHGNYLSVSNEECLTIPLNIYVPNVFTPNNDTLNEVFRIYGTGITEYHLVIYNRWGERIFSSDDIHKSWDAKNDPIGVYYYMITAKGNEGEIKRNGNVTVLR